MKTSALLLASLMLTSVAQAQVVAKIVITPVEKVIIARDLEQAADSGEHDRKTQEYLRKVAANIKDSTQDIKVEVKKLDDCENCEGKTREQIIARNVGRKLGKGAAWLTTVTSKPFMLAAGFMTGLIEKKDKNQDIVALYKFFLNHSKDFDKLYIEAGTPEELIESMLATTEGIIEKKSHTILKDFLSHLGVKREIPEDLSDFELTDEEIAAIDLDKVTPDFINNHAEYQELKPIIGEVTKEELEDIIMSGYFDKSIGFDNYKAALPRIHEGALTIVGQIFVPKIALGIISKSLAGIYAIPVIIADVATGVSVATCTQSATKEKFEADKDLRSFCSYVVNRSAYQLLKSRAKGYVAGKGFRAKIEEKLKKAKERRQKRREERARRLAEQNG